MRVLVVLFLLAGCGGVEKDPGSALHASDGGQLGEMDGKLGSPCLQNEDCESNLCNPYPAKGSNLCSNSCDASNVATNCPPPAVGCNKMGVCKF
jgi:hypothetical protein